MTTAPNDVFALFLHQFDLRNELNSSTRYTLLVVFGIATENAIDLVGFNQLEPNGGTQCEKVRNQQLTFVISRRPGTHRTDT